MFEEEEYHYTLVETQHFHIIVAFIHPPMVITDTIFESMDAAADHYFDFLTQLYPDKLSEKETELAKDAFYDLAEDSEETWAGANIGIQAGGLSLVVSDCFGCVPSTQN